jgi:hypothetical protein
LTPVPDGRGEAVSGEVGDDLLEVAVDLVLGAETRGVPLRMVGGMAVRVLCPTFPPRVRPRQDLDLASVSAVRRELTSYLEERGHRSDKRFNALYGHKQLFFQAPDGRAVDVLIDQLEMCHVLTFKDRIGRMPLTLDVTDVLLSKLQIIELNEKDAQDVLYLLSAFEVREGDDIGTIGLRRISDIVADDWGWWRTTVLNLDRIAELSVGDGRRLIPDEAPFDAATNIERIRTAVEEVPKSLRWKIRSRIGERKRWYSVPEEEAHD